MIKKEKKTKKVEYGEPFMIAEASDSGTSVRRNIASTIERTDRFKNIDDGLVPFRSSQTYGSSNATVDVRDAVVLCQKCYYNFATFRNIIDLMTEFSTNNIYWKGGSEKSRNFFKAWYNKSNGWDFQDRFFREYYRSGTVAIFRFDAEILPSDISRITQVYGEKNITSPQVSSVLKIPLRYAILNPADIRMTGTADFALGIYYKLLNDYEISRLKNPQTDEDEEIFNYLPVDIQKRISKGETNILIPLDPKKVTFVFYKKQDYEPFAVPMGYPVLEAINAKAEMMKIDMAIARSMQQMILLVTHGNEPDKHGISPKNLEAFRALFKNQSVGRTLVADYTTKAEFIVPQIGELLDPKKYEVLEREINVGLNNVFAGGEKFANQAQKVDLFVARLEQGRKAFLNNYLIPEVKRISKDLGFKNFPIPYFEDIELKDNTNNAKIYARLMELGLLTPEQGLRAIESNTLPDVTTMVQEQEEYKKLRDKGLYEPLVGGASANGQDAGRPDGTGGGIKKVSPIGTKASEAYSLKKVKENLIIASELETEIVEALKSKYKIKKLNKVQKEIAEQISQLIISNEEPENWKSTIAHYLENPEDKNKTRVNEIIEIAATHGLEPHIASILYASKKE